MSYIFSYTKRSLTRLKEHINRIENLLKLARRNMKRPKDSFPGKLLLFPQIILTQSLTDNFQSHSSPETPEEYKHFPALQNKITHSTLLEEFIFWTFKYEFPQNFVCFLLNMLPDPEYKVRI